MSGGQARDSTPGDRDKSKTLEAAYQALCGERDRLREARAGFARQLGPLPVAAGISTGTIAVFARHVHHQWLLWGAFGLFGAIVIVGFLYSSVPAYRQIRVAKEEELRRDPPTDWKIRPAADGEARPPVVGEDLALDEWHRRMLRLERAIYGEGSTKNRFGWPSWSPQDLQRSLDRERTGAIVVQVLFVVMIAALVAAQIS